MKLFELLKDFSHQIINGSDSIEIANLVYDSRKVQNGDVFVCIKGANRDSHDLIGEVVNAGAKAVIVQNDVGREKFDALADETAGKIRDTAIVKVDATRYALACMSAAYFGYPATRLVTIGVTGTKGKTTTAYMIRAVLEKLLLEMK